MYPFGNSAAKGAGMIKLNVNGRVHEVDAPADTPLLWVLREWLGMTGSKYGCGAGVCGACSVHLDGDVVRSCAVAVGDVGAAGHVLATGLDLLHPHTIRG